MSPETIHALLSEARDDIKTLGERITALERSIWWLFGAGAGIGMLSLAVASGTLRGVVGNG
jgi:hypothetical protein